MKVKSILISQPEPKENSPYLEIAKKEKLNIHFRPFIHVEGVDAKEMRTQKIDLSKFTGVIFTSKNAVDHYFRLAEEMRFTVPDSMRYVCQSEVVANYLQKHIVYRKRKIGFGMKSPEDMIPVLKKYHDDKYLFPTSDVVPENIIAALDASGVDYTQAMMYKTVCSDLSDMDINKYDMVVFFSPQGIKSLQKNFQEFNQGERKIAVFGENTQKVAEDAGFRVDIMAPTKEVPSMHMALQKFLKENGK